MSLRLLSALLFASVQAGCLGSALRPDGDGGANNADMAPDAVTAFYTTMQPILTPACGGCHGVAGTAAPAFMLSQPDMLQNLLAYPGIIGPTPDKSRLYAKGQHEGPAFTPAQSSVVADWINLLATTRPATDGGTKPTIAPFTPQMSGTNSIDLTVLNPMLAGAKLSFTAKMVGTSIELSSIAVATPSSTGVHVVHPLFVVWDQNLNPTPDSVDSFSNLDQTVPAAASTALGPGTLILKDFAAGSLLNIVFTTIEAKTVMGGGDGGTVSGGCKALAEFVQNIKPLLQGNGCSSNCHVGATPTAGLSWDATPDAQLCSNALGEIDKTTPANSRLLTRPDPNADKTHPQKINPFTNFQTAVMSWINAEK
jgi:hypothetical protein